ncbi:F-box protein At3g07870 [Linum perenne]
MDLNCNKRMKKNSSPTSTVMDLLPSEIIQDILSRLPITSLVQFRCVCSSWRALAADPHLTNLSLSRHAGASSSSSAATNLEDPCLILHCDFPIRNQLYFADLAADGEEKYRLRRIQAPFWSTMPEFDIIGSCNGLLCLSDSLYGDALYVYNPFSGKFLELPKSSRYADQEVVFGFGFHPTTKEYKVIKIVYYRNGGSSRPGYPRSRRTVFPLSEVQILTLGTPEWRIQDKISHQLIRRPGEALVNGRLHWVTRPRRYNPVRRLISFDLGDEQFREVAKPESGGLSRCNFNLVALKSCLGAAVYCNYGRLEIWVMKEYNVKESWVKEYSIGAYMPKGLKQNIERSYKIWRTGLNGRVRVLGVLKNGEILLEYKSRVLVCYDAKNGKFRDLKLQGVPKWFQANVVVGCLNWIDTPLIL